jgi:hypothetical protein
VGILLLTRTTTCVGARTAQSAERCMMNGSDTCWFTEQLTLALLYTDHSRGQIKEEKG